MLCKIPNSGKLFYNDFLGYHNQKNITPNRLVEQQFFCKFSLSSSFTG